MAEVTTDYERTPPLTSDKGDYEELPQTKDEKNRSPEDEKALLDKWTQRRAEAEDDRKQYLPQVKVNRKFAAKKQHLDVNYKDGRVLDVHERNGVKLVTADILGPYLLTAVGKMGSQDVRPNFLVAQDNEMAESIAKHINMAFGWCWENEVQADKRIAHFWRLLTIDGTCGARCRYDKRYGEVLGTVAYKDSGEPIVDKKEEYEYRASRFKEGKKVDEGPLREGKVVWETLTVENLLPPPGFDNPDDFPWEIVARPMLVKDVKKRFGDKADEIEEEEIDSPGSLTAGLGIGEGKDVKLQGRVMVYTGYEKPCSEYPKGQTVVFTKTTMLKDIDHLPYEDKVRGWTTGVHYFRWQIIPGRFWGQAFIEGGIGPQKIRNKRFTQIDAIIDKNMPKVFIEASSLARPKTGEPMEMIEVNPGAPLPQVNQGVAPGGWMLQDVKMQEEAAEKAMGLRGVSMGQAPQGVSAYSAMALLAEGDQIKLDAIAQEFRLEIVELAWDTMEAMRNWPGEKHMLVAGPEGQLQTFLFRSNTIPERYLVKAPRGGSLPRSQAAELQKVQDIWLASKGTPQPLPLEWYMESLAAGKAQDLPPSLGDQQAHKAELENIAMMGSMKPVPVAEYDDDIKHVEIHRAFQLPLQAAADMGDPDAMEKVEVLESHIREHLTVATTEAAGQGSASLPSVTGPGLAPQNMPANPMAGPQTTPGAMRGLPDIGPPTAPTP